MNKIVTAAVAVLLLSGAATQAAQASRSVPIPQLTDSEVAILVLLEDYAAKNAATHEHTPAIPLEDAVTICKAWGAAEQKQRLIDYRMPMVRLVDGSSSEMYVDTWSHPQPSVESKYVEKTCEGIKKSKAEEVRLF